jgi:hypothetical protein
MKNLIIVFLLFTFFQNSFSLIRNVPGSYSTIQLAINSSNYDDTVLIAPGQYFENINFRSKNVVLTSNYYLNNDPSFISTTIINGSTPLQPDSASVIIIDGHQDSTCVVQGFTITGGQGTKWKYEHDAMNRFRFGGGILIADTSNVVIQNNMIVNNQAYDTSGVTSAGAGGIRIGDSKVKVLNNCFIQNSGRFGTALTLMFSACIVKNNIFCLNYGATSYSGCTIWAECYNSGPQNIIENNTITRNTVISGYCGIYNLGVSLIVRNNIIWGNTGGTNSEIIGPVTLSYNDVENFSGNGNINLNPQFNDSNFILSNSSPCIDAGDSSSVYNDPQDPFHTGFALYPSRGTIRNDMGAYGGPLRRILTSTIIGIRSISNIKPDNFTLKQNYPNPFNPTTIISYALGISNIPSDDKNENSFSVKLIIYDVSGKEISTLVNEKQVAGYYQLKFDASSLPSGVYFYSLQTENRSITRKMILLK